MKKKGTLLRDGFTTGSCAAAAAKAALYSLICQEKSESISIKLPEGGRLLLPVETCRFNGNLSSASIIKDSGDEQDITHGVQIYADIERINNNHDRRLIVTGGDGVGMVTKNGLPVMPGKYAINPVPMKMILGEVSEILASSDSDYSYMVKIYVPAGKELGRKTLNPRLGILGGISILGTTGIVKPFSRDSFRDTIDLSMNVAKNAGIKEVVFSTGRGSERAAERYLPCRPPESYIVIGDFAGYSLKKALDFHMDKVVLAGRLGKLSKIAQGFFDTNFRSSSIDHTALSKWLALLNFPKEDIEFTENANTMMEVSDYFARSGKEEFFIHISKKIRLEIERYLSGKIDIRIIIQSYNGEILIDA